MNDWYYKHRETTAFPPIWRRWKRHKIARTFKIILQSQKKHPDKHLNWKTNINIKSQTSIIIFWEERKKGKGKRKRENSKWKLSILAESSKETELKPPKWVRR